MHEIVTILWALAIFAFIAIGSGMSGGGGYVWPASKTDPFEGRHIHIVSRPGDLRPEDCPDYPACSSPAANL